MPLVAYNAHKYVSESRRPKPKTTARIKRRLGDAYLEGPLLTSPCPRILNKNHMYDATEIFRTLSSHKKESFFKLGFYLLSFFYYLYRCVVSSLSLTSLFIY